LEVAVASERGARQTHNHDAHLVETFGPSLCLLGVADGFGMVGRAVPVAAIALSLVRDFLRYRLRSSAPARAVSVEMLRQLLLGALAHANARLFALSGSNDDFVASGASLTAVLVAGHRAFVAHVGDGRAYLQRRGRFEALTVDDEIAVESASSGKTAVPSKPKTRNLLWRTLGTQTKLEASVAHLELFAGDELVLCTDGLHRAVPHDEMLEALRSQDSAADAVERLMMIGKTRGSPDSSTVVVGRDLLTPSEPSPPEAGALIRGAIPGARGGAGAMREVGRSVLAITTLLIAAILIAVLAYHIGFEFHK
jgi:protein phosphatase